MKSKMIKINKIEDINAIVKQAEQVKDGVYIHRGRFVVDASSLMGIMSIDLTDPVKIEYPELNTDFDTFISQFEV